jgi:hypothetical protein
MKLLYSYLVLSKATISLEVEDFDVTLGTSLKSTNGLDSSYDMICNQCWCSMCNCGIPIDISAKI